MAGRHGGYAKGIGATARKDEDLEALGAIRNVQALRLDVTQPADIATAMESISKAGRDLYGLVNNAGIGTVGPIADMSFEEFDLCMKVNVYGHGSLRAQTESDRIARSHVSKKSLTATAHAIAYVDLCLFAPRRANS